MAAGTIATESSDQRVKSERPVARLQFEQLAMITGGGTTAQTGSIFVSGTIYRIDVIISAVVGNADLTAALTFTDDNGVAFGSELDQAGLAHTTSHYFDSESSSDGDANFNPVTHHGELNVSVAPNEDVGGTAQTLNVDIVLYVK